MLEDTATVVAVGAAFVAALAALYARWQAVAAQRANEISLHESRLAVHKGLGQFQKHISARGTSIKEEEVWRFAEIAELSEFYYPSDMHSRLQAIFEKALKVLSLNEEWEETDRQDKEKAKVPNRERHALMKEARDDCYKIRSEFKLHLRVGGT